MNSLVTLLLLTIPCTVHGIQVYENITNDVTTSTTKLLPIAPTPIIKNEADDKSNVTTSMENSKDLMLINNSSASVAPEKRPPKKQDDSSRDSTNIHKVEQQQRTSSNVKHEKFVPSPEISQSGIPEPTTESHRDNFYPSNQYYRPIKHSVHFHSSVPITNNWKQSEDLQSLPMHFPKFEEEVKQAKENIMWSQPYDSGKWFFMPDQQRVELPEKPKTTSNGKWKWVLDEDEQNTPGVSFNYGPKQSDVPSIPPNEFGYTFEIPSTDSTPFSFGSTKYDGLNQQSNMELVGSSTPLTTMDSEWDTPDTLPNGKLKHNNKGRGKAANISPWKKILHVLSAAIPIGLLISALTPQVIYVDPNSTSHSKYVATLSTSVISSGHSRSISPQNSINLLSTTKVRSLDSVPIQLPESSEIFDSEIGRKLMSNPLMDFLNVLRDNGNGMERTDSCDDRNFCEISRSGANSNASVLNKMLWKIANETPELQARKSGLEHIFHAIRNNNCSIFECKKRETNYHRQNYRKN